MTFREILEARRRVYRHLLRTPLHPYPGLSALLLVTEEAMEEAVRLLLEHTHNLAEEAGAAALAAARGLGERLAGKKVVLVLSGGNLSRARLTEILSR